MKRKFGESLRAGKYQFQVKEINVSVTPDNISRMISTFSFRFPH